MLAAGSSRLVWVLIDTVSLFMRRLQVHADDVGIEKLIHKQFENYIFLFFTFGLFV